MVFFHSSNDQNLHQIKQKQPHNKDADPELLLPDIPEEIHPIKFHSIDAESVKKSILKTNVQQEFLVFMQMAGRGS